LTRKHAWCATTPPAVGRKGDLTGPLHVEQAEHPRSGNRDQQKKEKSKQEGAQALYGNGSTSRGRLPVSLVKGGKNRGKGWACVGREGKTGVTGCSPVLKKLRGGEKKAGMS